MIYIAHRGLFLGPNGHKENHPSQIDLALSKGFEAELDLYVENNKLYLGHDGPLYEIEEAWLRKPKLWIHCKNKEAIDFFSKNKTYKYNYFWHENDKYTMTSLGHIWTHPSSDLVDMSILVMPETVNPKMTNAFTAKCYGICSDFIEHIQKIRGML